MKTENGAFFVKSAFFVGLKVPCFSYIPCNTNVSQYKEPFIRKGLPRFGECHNGLRVWIFDTIAEYDNFLKTKLNENEKTDLLSRLKTPDDLIMKRKKELPCLEHFKYLKKSITGQFEASFIKGNTSELELSNETVIYTNEESIITLTSTLDSHNQENSFDSNSYMDSNNTNKNIDKSFKDEIVGDNSSNFLTHNQTWTTNTTTDASTAKIKLPTLFFSLILIILIFFLLLFVFIKVCTVVVMCRPSTKYDLIKK